MITSDKYPHVERSRSAFTLTRRNFLGAIGMAPLASAAAYVETEPFDDVRVEFVQATESKTGREVLDIVLIQRLATSEGEAVLSAYHRIWRLRAEAFGPEARFVLDPPPSRAEALGPWQVRIASVSYARLRGRELSLSFRIIPLVVDGKTRQRLVVSMNTTVWSSQNGPTSVNMIRFAAVRPVPGIDPSLVVFRNLVAPEASAFAPTTLDSELFFFGWTFLSRGLLIPLG